MGLSVSEKLDHGFRGLLNRLRRNNRFPLLSLTSASSPDLLLLWVLQIVKSIRRRQDIPCFSTHQTDRLVEP